MRIVVVGIGYVGLSNALLLAQNHNVIAVDISEEKIRKLNSGVSPIVDAEASKMLNEFVKNGTLGGNVEGRSLSATNDLKSACVDADYIIISTPTDYDITTNKFDTKSIESVISQISYDAMIVIKSTIPIGYTETLRESYPNKDLIFSPEFLREGSALKDNLYPSRIIVGGNCKKALMFGDLLKEGSRKNNVPVFFTSSNEAEAIKLFANGYLAMRVSFFNELDTFAAIKNLNAKQIIQGISADPRIGAGYNNPSFGYGGYCFPKDTKQLSSNYDGIPNNIIESIVSSNETRKTFIADHIIDMNISVLGVYRLIMKAGSDNFRSSAVYDVALKVMERGVKVVVYEPEATNEDCKGMILIPNLEDFFLTTDLIICNRWSDELDEVSSKVFSRDIFNTDS